MSVDRAQVSETVAEPLGEAHLARVIHCATSPVPQVLRVLDAIAHTVENKLAD